MFKNVVWRGTGCDKVKRSQTFRFMFHRKSQYFLSLLQNDFCIFNNKLDLLGSMYVLSNKLYFLNKGVSLYTPSAFTDTQRFLPTKFPVAKPVNLTFLFTLLCYANKRWIQRCQPVDKSPPQHISINTHLQGKQFLWFSAELRLGCQFEARVETQADS